MKEIVDKGLGHVFITSSIFHFFNKTDFEWYLFKTFFTPLCFAKNFSISAGAV